VLLLTAGLPARPCSNQSISRTHRGRRTLLQRANGTDRRTDIVPVHRLFFAYYAGSAKNLAQFCREIQMAMLSDTARV